MVATAQAEAERTIEATQIIRLSVSVEDQRSFADAILNSPAPNEALRRAAIAYRTLIKSEA